MGANLPAKPGGPPRQSQTKESQKPRNEGHAVRSSGLGPELRRLEAGELAAPAAELGVRGPQLPGLPHRAAAGAPVHRGDLFVLFVFLGENMAGEGNPGFEGWGLLVSEGERDSQPKKTR